MHAGLRALRVPEPFFWLCLVLPLLGLGQVLTCSTIISTLHCRRPRPPLIDIAPPVAPLALTEELIEVFPFSSLAPLAPLAPRAPLAPLASLASLTSLAPFAALAPVASWL